MITSRFAVAVLAGLIFSTGATVAVPVPGGTPVGATDAMAAGGGDATTRAAGSTVETHRHQLQSGADHWQGRRLGFDGSTVVGDPGSAPADERTFGIWSVSDDGSIDSRVSTFTVGEDGRAEIRTRTLSGRFVVRYEGDPVYVDDGVGYRSAPPNGASVTVNNSAWTVRKQTLSAEWGDETVYNGQFTRLAFGSNRGEYTVAVSADGVAFSTLAAVFPESAYAEDYDARRDEDAIRLSVSTGVAYWVNATELPPGSNVFAFDATDTTASTRAGLTVEPPPSSNRFRRVERSDQTGDVLNTTIECSHCYLMVGGRDQGMFDIVELNDTNGDGNVTLQINTRYAGMSPGRQDVPENARPYMAGEDSTRRVAADEEVSPPDVNSEYALGEVRSDYGVTPRGRQDPLRAGVYDLTVASTKYMDVTIDSTRDYRDRQFSVRDEEHVQTVRLDEPSLAGLETGVAPGGVSERLDLATIERETTRSDRVAIGDRLVIGVDVSGVFGHLLAIHDNDIRGVVDNDEEGIDVTVKETSAPNPNRIDLVGSSARLLTDPDDDRLYVVLKTRSLRSDRPIEPGERYRATVSLSAADGYPYLPDGVRREASREVTLVDPDTNVTARVTANDRITVSGTATVAPGTVLSVSASARGPSSWKRATGIIVGTNGTWKGTLGFSDAPTDEFVVTVSYRDSSIARTDGIDVQRTAAPPGTPAGTTATASPTGPPGSTATVAGNASPTTGSSRPGTDGGAGTPSTGEPGSGPATERPDGGAAFVPTIPAIGGVLSFVVPAVAVLGLLVAVILRVIG